MIQLRAESQFWGSCSLSLNALVSMHLMKAKTPKGGAAQLQSRGHQPNGSSLAPIGQNTAAVAISSPILARTNKYKLCQEQKYWKED